MINGARLEWRRMSRARIQEFLHTWLAVDLSIGTIHQTVHEAAAAVAPAEATLLTDVQASGLLHADETPWPQHQQGLWLWVFVTTTTTLYVIAGRGRREDARAQIGLMPNAIMEIQLLSIACDTTSHVFEELSILSGVHLELPTGDFSNR